MSSAFAARWLYLSPHLDDVALSCGGQIARATREMSDGRLASRILKATKKLIKPPIKTLRAGQCNLKDGYAVIRQGEIWMLNVHISPWAGGNRETHDPLRERKLLLHRREINKLASRVAERGWTLVPLRIYLKSNRAKVELGLVRGKKQYDKREAIAKRDSDRDVERGVKDYQQE